MTDPAPNSHVPPGAPQPRPRSGSPLTWAVSLALAALVGALLFVAGYMAAGSGGPASCAAPAQEFRAFCQAYQRIQQQFVDDPDEEMLVEGAIQGMFEYGLADPFSGYMSPDDYQRAQEDLSGQFSGIGAEMGVRNVDDPEDLESCTTFSESCVLVVVAPLEGSPAEAAGLQPGDVVVAIDGQSVNGMTLDEAVKQVRGEAGTDVTLTIRRDEERLDLTITRAEIQVREVSSRMLEGQAGYVALHGFSNTAADQLRTAIQELLDDGARSIVFDLRNNPGGYIEAARDVASEFIGDGVVFTQESAGNEVKEWEATGDGLAIHPRIPLVVLVNRGSASASEIVAAALQERGRGTIVGEPTYGKNTVQVWSELDNGAGVRITVSRWFTPERNSVAPDGVQPDELVRVPEGTPPDEDPFVERALEVISDGMLGTDESPAPAADTEPSAGTSLLPGAGGIVSYDPRGQLQAVA